MELPSVSLYPESQPDAEWRRKVRVLIAEDNPGDVYLVREALESHGLDAELSVQQDGEAMMAQIQLLEAGKIPSPDIILLDLNLPKYSGATLLERLRRCEACAAIPVVIVTSSDSDEDREMAARHRARAYFRKPLDFDEFLKLGGIVKEVVQQ